MADVTQTLRQGEQRPVYGAATLDGGTLTTSGTPTYTLYDAEGQVVAGHNAQAVTGNDTGPLETVRAWVDLDSTALPAGRYRLVFRLVTTGSDSRPRTFLPAVDVVVAPAASAGGSYSLWPTAADLESRLAAAGVTVRDGADLQGALDALVAEVERETRRQFVPDAEDTTRFFDGTGAAELWVDELVSLTEVRVLGYPDDLGTALPNVELVYRQGEPRDRIVVARHSTPATGGAYGAPGYGWGLHGAALTPRAFPAGRQNIAVTGRFGYAETVPADLWRAVLGEAAARLTDEATFSTRGRLVEYKDDEVSEKYALGTTATSVDGLRGSVSLGWSPQFAATVARYRRRRPKRAMHSAPRMI